MEGKEYVVMVIFGRPAPRWAIGPPIVFVNILNILLLSFCYVSVMFFLLSSTNLSVTITATKMFKTVLQPVWDLVGGSGDHFEKNYFQWWSMGKIDFSRVWHYTLRLFSEFLCVDS